MRQTTKQKVLFICTANSARSQMAEALLRHKAPESFEVYSGGTYPEKVDDRAIAALNAFGLNTQGLSSTDIADFKGQAFDYVITLCDKASNECRQYPNAKKQLAWDFPDPKSRAGNNPFSATLSELNNRLSMFLLIEEKSQNQTLDNLTTGEQNLLDAGFAPAVFFKSLTDPIRLTTLMLTHYYGELCVCELMEALDEQSQPKVSRNLAILKKNEIILDRKHGQWVFYRVNPALPLWMKAVIAQTTENNLALIAPQLQRLNDMQNRPSKESFCRN